MSNAKGKIIFNVQDKEMNLEDLPKLCLIAGKNGSGKSTCLKQLSNKLFDDLTNQSSNHASNHPIFLMFGHSGIDQGTEEIHRIQEVYSETIESYRNEMYTTEIGIDFKNRINHLLNYLINIRKVGEEQVNQELQLTGIKIKFNSSLNGYDSFLKEVAELNYCELQGLFHHCQKLIKIDECDLKNWTEYVKVGLYNLGITYLDLSSTQKIFNYLFILYPDEFGGEFNQHLENNSLQFKPGFKINFSYNSSPPIEYKLFYENYKVKFEFVKDQQKVRYDQLSSGERFILFALTLEFLYKKVNNDKLKIFNENITFLLDEPDSHLEQVAIDSFMNIIEKILVKGLKFKVILTTHNVLTTNYFDDDNILVLEKLDLPSNTYYFSKPTFNLVSQLLTNDLYYSFKKGKISIKAFEKIIETIDEESIKDGKFIERLIKRHMKRTSDQNVLKLIKRFHSLGEQDSIQIDMIDVDCLNKISLKDYLEQKKVYIIWPKNVKNPCFDFITIYEKSIHFYQVTIEHDVESKLNKTVIGKDKTEKIPDNCLKFEFYYKELIEQINNEKYSVKYFLIYRNETKSKSEKVENYEFKKIKKFQYDNEEQKDPKIHKYKTFFYNLENRPTTFDLYSIELIGEDLDSEILKKFRKKYEITSVGAKNSKKPKIN